jgi:hypothetical protein
MHGDLANPEEAINLMSCSSMPSDIIEGVKATSCYPKDTKGIRTSHENISTIYRDQEGLLPSADSSS